MILFYVYQTKGWQNKCLRNWWETSLLTIRVNTLFSVEFQKCFSLNYRNLSLFIMHYFQCNKFTFAISFASSRNTNSDTTEFGMNAIDNAGTPGKYCSYWTWQYNIMDEYIEL